MVTPLFLGAGSGLVVAVVAIGYGIKRFFTRKKTY
jgi:hypothetical protein